MDEVDATRAVDRLRLVGSASKRHQIDEGECVGYRVLVSSYQCKDTRGWWRREDESNREKIPVHTMGTGTVHRG